jgi:hypothetical protein
MKTRLVQFAVRLSAAIAVAFATSGGCVHHSSGDSGGGGGGGSSKVSITEPSASNQITVYGVTSIVLGGPAAIDAWSNDWRIEPQVRWFNTRTGDFGEAADTAEWIWFFGYRPTNHTWSANVPLIGGPNVIRVEAYYTGSGTVVGQDVVTVVSN